MKHEPILHDTWSPCPPGTLSRCGERAKGKVRLRRMATSAAVAVVLFAGLLAGNRLLFQETLFPGETQHGGLWCHEVAVAIPSMVAGELSAEQKSQVEIHLQNCPRCRALLKRMQQEQMQGDRISLYRGSVPCCDECRAAELSQDGLRSTVLVATIVQP